MEVVAMWEAGQTGSGFESVGSPLVIERCHLVGKWVHPVSFPPSRPTKPSRGHRPGQDMAPQGCSFISSPWEWTGVFLRF